MSTFFVVLAVFVVVVTFFLVKCAIKTQKRLKEEDVIYNCNEIIKKAKQHRADLKKTL